MRMLRSYFKEVNMENMNMDDLKDLMGKIEEAMKASYQQQNNIDAKTDELYQETRIMMVEKGKEELETLKQNKKEYDEMTVNALKDTKKAILTIKKESEDKYQEMLLSTMQKRKDIENKLARMRAGETRPEKLTMIENSAAKALEKVNADMKEFQDNHFEKMALLDKYENNINRYAMELDAEEELNNVKIEEEKKAEEKETEEKKVDEKETEEKKVEEKETEEKKVDEKETEEKKADEKEAEEKKVEIKEDPAARAKAELVAAKAMVESKEKESGVQAKTNTEAKVNTETKPQQGKMTEKEENKTVPKIVIGRKLTLARDNKHSTILDMNKILKRQKEDLAENIIKNIFDNNIEDNIKEALKKQDPILLAGIKEAVTLNTLAQKEGKLAIQALVNGDKETLNKVLKFQYDKNDLSKGYLGIVKIEKNLLNLQKNMKRLQSHQLESMSQTQLRD